MLLQDAVSCNDAGAECRAMRSPTAGRTTALLRTAALGSRAATGSLTARRGAARSATQVQGARLPGARPDRAGAPTAPLHPTHRYSPALGFDQRVLQLCGVA